LEGLKRGGDVKGLPENSYRGIEWSKLFELRVGNNREGHGLNSPSSGNHRRDRKGPVHKAKETFPEVGTPNFLLSWGSTLSRLLESMARVGKVGRWNARLRVGQLPRLLYSRRQWHKKCHDLNWIDQKEVGPMIILQEGQGVLAYL
jgi:hypothetical protein